MSDGLVSEHELSPIFEIKRHGVSEISVFGVCAVYINGRAYFLGSPDISLISRSTLKPLQVYSLCYLQKSPEWAMAISSHSGEACHVESLRSLQRSLHVSDDSVVLPESYPLDVDRSRLAGLISFPKLKVFHPCFGKHLLYSHVSSRFSSSVSYAHIDHPVHENLSSYISSTVSEFEWIPDSCGMPTLVIGLSDYLHLWQSFSRKSDSNADLLRFLWGSNPQLIGGKNRLDTEIVAKSKGLVLAKEGADGILVVQTNDPSLSDQVTIIIKISSGYSIPYLGLALYSLLEVLPGLPQPLLTVQKMLSAKLRLWISSGQDFTSRVVL